MGDLMDDNSLPTYPLATAVKKRHITEVSTQLAPSDWVNVPTAPTPPPHREMNYHQLLEVRTSALEGTNNQLQRQLGVYQERYRLIKEQLEIALKKNMLLEQGTLGK